jgi:pSer/pThr/pTyr-binding forkhead associated (FHA) protein
VPEQLLTVLKLCLLALLWLFFLRVLRAVWAEVDPPRPATAAAAAPAGRSGRSAKAAKAKPAKRPARSRRRPVEASRLVVGEPAGRAGTEYAVDGELTIGRAPGCSVVFDEQYVSQVHARIFRRDGAVFAEDLGSTNGTWVNGSRAVGQMPARPGDRIQIGNVVMEVR